MIIERERIELSLWGAVEYTLYNVLSSIDKEQWKKSKELVSSICSVTHTGGRN